MVTAHCADQRSCVNGVLTAAARVLRAMPGTLILASTSPARRALMDSLGVTYEVEAPGVDEDVPPGTSAHEAVALLAERKARAVSRRHPPALVVGSDQLAVVDGQALGKPADRERAREQLTALAGRT